LLRERVLFGVRLGRAGDDELLLLELGLLLLELGALLLELGRALELLLRLLREGVEDRADVDGARLFEDDARLEVDLLLGVEEERTRFTASCADCRELLLLRVAELPDRLVLLGACFA